MYRYLVTQQYASLQVIEYLKRKRLGSTKGLQYPQEPRGCVYHEQKACFSQRCFLGQEILRAEDSTHHLSVIVSRCYL